MKAPILFSVLAVLCITACATRGAASAEEYYSIGMAYFEVGKYEEAEWWLNRARSVDKTKLASEYNLGRIAYELGRYDEAIKLFERVLAKDTDNVLALKAAAYARIKTGDLATAETLYRRVLELEPESADQGYNYALVLMALDKPEQAEAVLLKYKITMAENKDTLLLFARVEKALNKVEAMDAYNQWLQDNPDAAVRYEYAQVLEAAQFYVKALEEYRTALEELAKGDKKILDRTEVRFMIARLLLIADPEKTDGITELETAVTEGFSDTEKLTALLDEGGISAVNKDEIRRVIEGIEKAAADKAKAAKKADTANGETGETGESAGPVSP